jgi:hypothetical protein
MDWGSLCLLEDAVVRSNYVSGFLMLVERSYITWKIVKMSIFKEIQVHTKENSHYKGKS